MPSIQGRLPTAEDFEDIALFDVKELKGNRRYDASHSSQESNISISSSGQDDPHTSIQSVSSTLSTPTLASDSSSLRSSLSSISSPALSNPHYSTSSMNPPSVPNKSVPRDIHHMHQNSSKNSEQPCTQPFAISSAGSLNEQTQHGQNKPYSRRRSVPMLVDNTSMASLTIRSQASSRSRKQREMEFDADIDDEIWPADGLMFNVPMSPALYAQQKMKQYQMNTSNGPAFSRSQNDLSSRKPMGPHNTVPESRHHANSATHAPSPLHQQISVPHRRPSTNSRRKSLPSIDEDRHKLSKKGINPRIRSMGDDTYPQWNSNYESQSRISSMSSLPALLSNRGSFTSDVNTSIDGLDPDASDLTLELCRLEERQRRVSSSFGDNSNASITSLAISETDTTLPSPSMGSLHASEDGGSDRDSRRSSLTRPENLPPKSPEEEKKHMKEYEKLLRDAAAAEKRKQHKREKEAKAREHQAKQDYAIWQHWLDKDRHSKISSDLKWRGIPEKLRGTIWKLQSQSKDLKIMTNSSENNDSNNQGLVGTRHEIIHDSELMWPDCCIFGAGRPLHESLIFVVEKFLMLRPEIQYSFGLTGIAALLLLYLDTGDSIQVMLSIISPGSLIHAVLSGNERLASANYVSFGKVFRRTFERLSEHFEKVHLSDSEVLGPLIGSLFTAVLPSPEAAARVLDVYVFDGDSFLLRVSLGLLRINEAWLYASKEEILEQLMNPRNTTEDELMSYIRDVTRGQ